MMRNEARLSITDVNSDQRPPDTDPRVPADLVRGIPADRARAAASLPANSYGLLYLLWSDYCRHYEYKRESSNRRAILCLPRVATNSTLHATGLTRAILGTSPRLSWIWRRLMLALHGCDITVDAVIGPGLMMPHPTGIVIGTNTVIGRNAVIQHQVTVTPVTINWRWASTGNTLQIGDDVTIFPGAFILGELTIGDGAIIGAKCLVTRDVPAGHIVTMRGGVRPATAEERAGAR